MLNVKAWKRVAIATATIVLPYTAAYSQQPDADSLMTLFSKIASEGKIEDKPRLMEILNTMVSTGDEKGMETASTAAFFLGEYGMSDSIFKAAAKKFPAGGAAKTVAYVTMLKDNTTGGQLEKAYNKWAAQFSDTSIRNHLHEDAKMKIALAYAGEKDYTNASRWAVMQYEAWKRVQQDMEIGKLAFNKGDTATGLEWQSKAMARLDTLPVKNGMDTLRSDAYLQEHASLLFQAGKKEAALKYITKVWNNNKNASFELKKDYGLILAANSKVADARPVLEELIQKGRSDKQVTEALKKMYVQRNGSDKGFDTLITHLKADLIDSIKAKAAKEMLDEVAPDFTLKDLNNKTVSLRDLKGKVVVLDFWATWCGPCKKSFPAMKMAVEKYRADKNVVFLFIDCLERAKDAKETVQKFITANNYPFRVLLDGQDATVVKKYKVSGIPVKFVIDGKGKIRFRVLGFDGGEDAAVEELSALIELARNK